MKRPLQFTIVSGLVAGAMTIAVLNTGGRALAASDDKPQSKSEAAAVREAIRFERAKDAADRRQLRMEAAHPSVPVPAQASEANGGGADRWNADRLAAEPQAKGNVKTSKSDAVAMAEAIRFERYKDAAAARQMHRDTRQAGEASRSTEKPKNTK
jgi:hypothetical protein